MMGPASIPPPSTHLGVAGIVLSGGGARGAYEAGVLRYLYQDLARKLGRPPRIEIISGTSVGAINGAYLASVMDEAASGVDRLVDLWTTLELDHVLGFGVGQAFRIPRVLLGGAAAAGIFDVRPLIRIVERNMRWHRLARNLRSGTLRALSVSATHVSTGRPWVFVDAGPGVKVPERFPHSKVAAERIGPQHVLASAAIPIVFPPVAVHGELFVDGGLRLNTPMTPPIHLGARRLLVIGLSTPPWAALEPSVAPGVFPGVAFLLGKVLNAFFLDRVNADFIELDRWNKIIDDGTAVYGPDFIDRMNAKASSEGRAVHQRVHALAIHPSEDIGRMASKHLREHEVRIGRRFGRGVMKLLDLGEGSDADLLTYLLFDGEFAKKLIDLGHRDAARREEELARFFVTG